MTKLQWTVCLLTVAALGLPAAAEPRPQIDIDVRVERERTRQTDEGPVVEREPVTEAFPGDLLVYTLRAVNRGDAPALNSRIDDPVPQGTELVLELLDAARDLRAPSAASLDGGKSWQAFPAMVTRHDADGNPRRVPAAAAAYTHLRWELDALAPGESREVGFRVRVR